MTNLSNVNFPTSVDGVMVMSATCGDSGYVVGINICHWIDKKASDDDYDTVTSKLDTWMKEHNFTYYGAPRDSFNEWAAMDKAKEGGYVGVIMEDLS